MHKEFFVIALFKHRFFGNIFLPYFIQKHENNQFHVAKERITLLNLDNYCNKLTPAQIETVKIIDEYNDAELRGLFSKNSKNTQEFLKNLSEETIENHVRPFIEKRMLKIFNLIISHKMQVYVINEQSNIYDSDKIQITAHTTETSFHITKETEGSKYYLTLQHEGKDIKLTKAFVNILTDEPCIVIVNKTAYLLDDMDGKKLLPFMQKDFIQIPPSAEKKFYETFVTNLIRKHRITPHGFTISEKEVIPIPYLSIEKELDGNTALLLKFKYDEHFIYYSDTHDHSIITFTHEHDTYHYTVHKGNPAYEEKYLALINKLGLVHKYGAFYTPASTDNHAVSIYDLVQWLNSNIHELKLNNFHVEQLFLDKKYYTDEVGLNINLYNKNDWFDVHALVNVGEFSIPFSKFKQNIIQYKKEYTLPNGDIFILPDEWFAKYKDLFLFSHEVDDKLVVNKQHFPILEMSGIDKKRYKTLFDIDLKKCHAEMPANVQATLRPYQKDGYSWMYSMQKHNFGICLADDMGLGKTLQTLTLLQRNIADAQTITAEDESSALIDQANTVQLSLFDDYSAMLNTGQQASSRASLIVVPTSLIHNWLDEIHKFVPNLRASTYVGPARKDFGLLFSTSDIIITTYGIVRNDCEKIAPFKFNYIILDESQIIKNPESKTYKAATELSAHHRLVLTGTPIENSLTDLWSQMNFLNRGLLGDFSFFKNEFLIPIEKNGDDEKKKKLRKLISPFIIRRTKKEVEKDLPDITEQIIKSEMSEEQKKYYEQEKSKARNAIFNQIESDGIEKSAVVILSALTRLRQIANHPKLVDASYAADSGKFDDIMQHLQNIQSSGSHKVLVFSFFVKYLDLIEKHLAEHKLTYLKFTGETKNRKEIIDQFQNDENIKYLLISLKAGGFGLNITAADYVVMLDPWWNPQVENQAISRAHRIGQTKKVFVYKFISVGTIEEKIHQLQQRKSELADAFISGNTGFKALTVENLQDMLS